MLRIIFRIFGFFLLAIALITAVLDLTRSIANSGVVFTPLGLEWRNFDVASLQAFQVAMERHLGLSWLWTGIVQNILLMPSWVVFTFLAIIFLWIGHKPQRHWQRRFGR